MTSYLILQIKRISRIFSAWHDFAFDSPHPKIVKNGEKTKWTEFLPWVTFFEQYLKFPLVYTEEVIKVVSVATKVMLVTVEVITATNYFDHQDK